jgi:class 3 adenylate cyclase
MIRCAACGEENPERARFCLNCGSELAGAAPAIEVRKTVTILFADVVGSTSLGERTDPESTRRMLSRYFDVMRTVVERHGGSVEKFIGDAVMAVFGIPVLHEDDALRAVRAAHEMRSSVALLNQELASGSWSPIALRIGVNTGEVVAGDAAQGHTLVTGDAVNVAARLEQAASPDEILLGETTYRLVRAATDAEPIPPLDLKGKADPLPAFRLTAVGTQQQSLRRLDTPLVGRQRELKLLTEAFDRANEEQACYLFTLLGTAGVGKSRLVHEFLGLMRDRAQVIRARCLPYGEGITFWPVIELVQAAAGIELEESPASAVTKLRTLLENAPDRDPILDRVCPTIGLSGDTVSAEEVFWGVRKFLESVASTKPLIVVIDDLQWAEPTMLDLVDHIADWSREAPILLLAIARPELLEARPMWGGGKLNSTTILLEPLDSNDAIALIANLVDDADLAKSVQRRIGDTAEGNPLFVEELVAMLIDEGVLKRENGAWQAMDDLQAVLVPPSISALVAARLDRLEPMERDLIGRASVVGKTFQRSAVAELSPPEGRDGIGPRLMTLVRKELVRPDRSAAIGDEAFRFRHLLVRDAAYASLTKEQRADLHARFADWLERSAGQRLLEFQEVIGYHLEQAYRYRSELGLADELTNALMSRAAKHLRAAGLRARGRNDAHAAVHLLSRAAQLTTDEAERVGILLITADAKALTGDMAGAKSAYQSARETAARTGDELLQVHAELLHLDLLQMTDPNVDEGRMFDLAEQVTALASARGEKLMGAHAEYSRSMLYLNHCRWMDCLAALERARALVDDNEEPGFSLKLMTFTWNALRWGPVPAAEAIARIQADGADDPREGPRLAFIAPLLAMQGQIAEARGLLDKSGRYFEERGMRVTFGGNALEGQIIERLAGDLEAADSAIATGIAVMQEMGETGVLSTLASVRADVLYELGREDEMQEAIDLARETGSPADISTQAGWRYVAAKAAADKGRMDEARMYVDEAVALIEETDFPEMRAWVFEALAHVEATAGQPAAWEAALQRALAEHEVKGNLVGAQRVKELLEKGPA